jgi:hypothetical protein
MREGFKNLSGLKNLDWVGFQSAFKKEAGYAKISRTKLIYDESKLDPNIALSKRCAIVLEKTNN